MSGEANNRGLIELAALYAAGALSGEELAGVEARLASGDEDLRAAISALSATIEALGSAAPAVAPRPETFEALLARIVASSGEPSPAEAIRPAKNRSSRRRSRRSQNPPPETAEQTGELVVLRAAAAQWTPVAEGVETRTLFVDRRARRITLVMRLVPGAMYPAHYHAGAEECFVLQGDLRVGDHVLGPGDYQRAPKGSWHGEQRTATGCVCVVMAPL